MLEHSIYAVISPEGCASILWRNPDKAQDAAAAMKITAQDLLELKVIDGIVPEPPGGAHRDPEEAIQAVGETVSPRAVGTRSSDAATKSRKRAAGKVFRRWDAISSLTIQHPRKRPDIGHQIVRPFQRREMAAFLEIGPVRDIEVPLDQAARRKRNEIDREIGDRRPAFRCARRSARRSPEKSSNNPR